MRAFLSKVLVVSLTMIGTAADQPYYGKWKLNPAKSDFGQLTLTFEQAPGGAMKATMDGLSYTFTTDGKPAQTPWGTTETWKAADPTTWENTSRANGKVTATSTMKLSADGKTLTVNAKMMKASGESSNEMISFARVSGTTGLAGTWKAAKMTSSSPSVLNIAGKGVDGFVIAAVDQN